MMVRTPAAIEIERIAYDAGVADRGLHVAPVPCSFLLDSPHEGAVVGTCVVEAVTAEPNTKIVEFVDLAICTFPIFRPFQTAYCPSITLSYAVASKL